MIYLYFPLKLKNKLYFNQVYILKALSRHKTRMNYIFSDKPSILSTLMGCVNQSEQDIADHRRKNYKRTIVPENRNMPSNTNNKLCIPNNATTVNGSHKNLFKTFSDWGQNQDPHELEQRQAVKVRKRRGSQDINIGQSKFFQKIHGDRQLKTTTTTNIQISNGQKKKIQQKLLKESRK